MTLFGQEVEDGFLALANGLVLTLIAFSIVFEAARRFESPGPIDGGLVLAGAAVGLAADLAGMWFLSSHSHSINVRSARLHILGDALSSAGVLAGGLAIAVTSTSGSPATRAFALGRDGAFRPLALSGVATGAVQRVFTADVLPGPTGGTPAAPLQALTGTRYWKLGTAPA